MGEEAPVPPFPCSNLRHTVITVQSAPPLSALLLDGQIICCKQIITVSPRHLKQFNFIGIIKSITNYKSKILAPKADKLTIQYDPFGEGNCDRDT